MEDRSEDPLLVYVTSNGVGNAWVPIQVQGLSERGLRVQLHQLHAPEQVFFRSDEARALLDATRTLYPLDVPRFVADVLRSPLRFGSRFWRALGRALWAAPRESPAKRLHTLLQFPVACHLASSLDERTAHIHADMAHSPATMAMYAAELLGVSFSFTGHANDLFQRRIALADKVSQASAIMCISQFHADLYRGLGARDDQLQLIYLGIDTQKFVPPEAPPATLPAGETGADDRPHILSSGRLVAKKGFDVLIDAAAILKQRGVSMHTTIAGSGPLDQALKEQVTRLGLEDDVVVTGKPLLQEDNPAFMGSGTVYVLACVWASDDDVDGLPLMLLEAMSCGLPAISTRLVGIPDLVRNEHSGLLVESGDATALADAIQRYLEDPELRARMGKQGRELAVAEFDIRTTLDQLARVLGAQLPG